MPYLWNQEFTGRREHGAYFAEAFALILPTSLLSLRHPIRHIELLPSEGAGYSLQPGALSVLALSDGAHSIPPSSLSPSFIGAAHKSQLEMKRLEKMKWDLREAALAAVILASGVWMIIAGLTKLWGE
jgi:hypothetical protein